MSGLVDLEKELENLEELLKNSIGNHDLINKRSYTKKCYFKAKR